MKSFIVFVEDDEIQEAKIRGFIRSIIMQEMGPGSMFANHITEIAEGMHDDAYVRDMVLYELQKITNLIKEVK